MFGAAVCNVAADVVSKAITEAIDDEDGRAWDDACQERFFTKIRAEVLKIKGADVLVKSSLVQMQFWGVDVQVKISSMEEEARMRMAAHVKTLSWSHQLPPLQFEGIIGEEPADQNTPIADSLLAPWRSPRTTLLEAL